MSSFDMSYTTFYQPAVRSIALSCTIVETLETVLTLKSRSVRGHSPCEFVHDLYVAEITGLELSFCRFYTAAPYTVSCCVTIVESQSRSSKLVPMESPYATSY